MGIAGEIVENLRDARDSLADTVGDVAKDVAEQVDDFVEDAADVVSEIGEEFREGFQAGTETLKPIVEEAWEKGIKIPLDNAIEKIKDIGEIVLDVPELAQEILDAIGQKLLEELLEYLSTLSIVVEFKAKGYARVQVSTSLFNYGIEFDVCKGFTYQFELLDWTKVYLFYNFDNGLITFEVKIHDKAITKSWVKLKFAIPATPVPLMMLKQCEEEKDPFKFNCHICNGKRYSSIEELIEKCLLLEDTPSTVWTWEWVVNRKEEYKRFHSAIGFWATTTNEFVRYGLKSGTGRNSRGNYTAKWFSSGYISTKEEKYFSGSAWWNYGSKKWATRKKLEDHFSVLSSWDGSVDWGYGLAGLRHSDPQVAAEKIRRDNAYHTIEKPKEDSYNGITNYPPYYNSTFNSTRPAYSSGTILEVTHNVSLVIIGVDYEREVENEFGYDCLYRNTKIPDVPMQDKECCSMIRQILDRLGGDDWEAIIPKSLTNGEDSIERVSTIPDMMAKTIEYQDELAGSYPVEIEIQDSDLTKAGDQTISLEFPNQAEFLAEIYGMMYELLKNLTVTQELAFKAMTIAGLNQQALIKTRAQVETIQDYLDFSVNEREKEYKWLFTPGEQDWDKILEETDFKVKTQEYNDDEQTLKSQLIELMQGAAIIRARYFRQVGDNFDFMKIIKQGASLGADFLESEQGEKKDKKWKDWIDFIEDDLMKRHEEGNIKPDIKVIEE